MDNLTRMWEKFLDGVPNAVAALILLLVAFLCAFIVKCIVKGKLKSNKLDKSLEKDNANDESKITIRDFVAKLCYLVTFALFVPGIFDRLELTDVSRPVSSMMEKMLNYLPNIIAASILLFIGLFIAKGVRDILIPVLKKLNVDKAIEKVGVEGDNKVTISEMLANVVYVLILIPVVIASLDALKIEAISKPATEMLNNILVFMPRIGVAVVIIYVGKFIATFAGDLLEKLFVSIGTDKATKHLLKSTGTKIDKEFSLSHIIGSLVKYVIIIFFLVEGLNILQLEVLTNIGNKIIAYMPYAISSTIILGIALLLGNFVENSINSKFDDSKVTALILKVIIVTIGSFITLYQLGVASSLVQSAFIIVLSAFAIAFAVSFGIGGRDFASHMLTKLEKRIDNKSNK